MYQPRFEESFLMSASIMFVSLADLVQLSKNF